MKHRIILAVFAFLLLLPLGMNIYHPAKAKADNTPGLTSNDVKNGTLTWVNRAVITGVFGGSTLTFTDSNIADTKYEYKVESDYGCAAHGSNKSGVITLPTKFDKNSVATPDITKGTIDLDIIPPNSVNVTCANTSPNTITLPIADPASGALPGCPGSVSLGPPAPGQDCSKSTNGLASGFIYTQTDSTTVSRVDGDSDWVFTQNSTNTNVYIQKGNGNSCPNALVESADHTQYKMYEMTDNKGKSNGKIVPPSTFGNITFGTCYFSQPAGYAGESGVISDKFYYLANANSNGHGVSTAAVGGDTGSCSAGTVACNNTLCEASGAITLSWIVCPVVNGIADATDTIFDKVVQPLLQTGSINFTNPKDDSYKVFQVWSNFRIFGNVLLIIGLMVIVFGQSIGGGLIDSYTAKKVAPRLLIAAVLINLSIYIVALLVDITNIIGGGVYGLITAPVAASGGLKFTLNVGSGGLGLVVLVGLGIAIATKLALSFIVPLLLAVLLPAFLAIMGVIATLILRRAIIILLVIVSPVAFALYCLPNTEKYFKQWWGLLIKTLMVYPITMAIIGGVNLLASIIGTPNNTSGVTQFFANLTSMILIIMPLFIIPFAFKMSGGLIGSISGSIQGFTAGWRKGLRRAGGAKAAAEIKNRRAGGGRDEGGTKSVSDRLTRAGNKMGTYIFNADEKIPHTLGEKGIWGFRGAYTRLDAKIRGEQLHQSKELAGVIQDAGGNDQTGRVIAGDVTEGMTQDVRDRLEQELGVRGKDGEMHFTGLHSAQDYDDAAAILDASDEVTERQAAGALRGLKGTMLNLKKDGKGYADVTAAGALIIASHGFATEQDVVNVGKLIEEKTGSREYADTIMTQMEINGAKSGLKVTYSHSRDADGNIITGTQAGRDLDRARSKSYSDIAMQKAHAVKSDVKALMETVKLSEMEPDRLADQVELWQEPHDEEQTDYLGNVIIDKATGKPKVVHMPGVSKDVAERRVEDIKAKAEAAKRLLSTIASTYNPGAGDSSLIAAKALEKLGEEVPPMGSGTGDDEAPPPTAVAPPPPAPPEGGIPAGAMPPPDGIP